jgi:IclR family pca regulon transcriptional regulator
MTSETGAPPEPAARDISTTFAKGLAVLRAFDDSHSRLTLAEIAQASGLDRASVRRLALTLVHLGYAQKEGRHFALTPRVLTLAGSVLRGNRFGTHVQPVLDRAARRLGLGVSLAIADADAVLYIAQSTVEAGSVSFGFTIGSRLPLLHTAVGRMILAMGAEDWRARAIATAPLARHTAETEMDRAAIAAAVARCRAEGYAMVAGEFEAGVTGFAVPIGGVRRVEAALGASQPTLTLGDAEARLRLIAELQRAAAELSREPLFS